MSKQKKYFNLNLPVLLFAMSCSVMWVMFGYEFSSRESPRLYISVIRQLHKQASGYEGTSVYKPNKYTAILLCTVESCSGYNVRELMNIHQYAHLT